MQPLLDITLSTKPSPGFVRGPAPGVPEFGGRVWGVTWRLKQVCGHRYDAESCSLNGHDPDSYFSGEKVVLQSKIYRLPDNHPTSCGTFHVALLDVEKLGKRCLHYCSTLLLDSKLTGQKVIVRAEGVEPLEIELEIGWHDGCYVLEGGFQK